MDARLGLVRHDSGLGPCPPIRLPKLPANNEPECVPGRRALGRYVNVLASQVPTIAALAVGSVCAGRVPLLGKLFHARKERVAPQVSQHNVALHLCDLSDVMPITSTRTLRQLGVLTTRNSSHGQPGARYPSMAVNCS